MIHRAEILMKLPSLNEVIYANRQSKYLAASMKNKLEAEISWYLLKLRPIKNPVKIHCTWVEKTAKRDADNIIAGGKKYILDALVSTGVLPDDSQKWVKGFTDIIQKGEDWKIILEIEELEEEVES